MIKVTHTVASWLSLCEPYLIISTCISMTISDSSSALSQLFTQLSWSVVNWVQSMYWSTSSTLSHYSAAIIVSTTVIRSHYIIYIQQYSYRRNINTITEVLLSTPVHITMVVTAAARIGTCLWTRHQTWVTAMIVLAICICRWVALCLYDVYYVFVTEQLSIFRVLAHSF
jgi:hypothetical protein